MAARVHAMELLGLLKLRDAAVGILRRQLEALGAQPFCEGVEKLPSYPRLPPVPQLSELLPSSLSEVASKSFDQAKKDNANLVHTCRVDLERHCSAVARTMEKEVDEKLERWKKQRLDQYVLAMQASREAEQLRKKGLRVPPFPYQPGELELACVPRTAAGDELLKSNPPPGAEVAEGSVVSEAGGQSGAAGEPVRAGPGINCPLLRCPAA